MGKNKTSFKAGDGRSGRKPGSKNRTTEEIRQFIQRVVDSNLDGLEDDLLCMSPTNRWIILDKISKCFLPALTKNQNDNNNTGEMKITVEYVDVKANDGTDNNPITQTT